MDSIGVLVLIVATAAIGLAAVIVVVQLWRHQPVHQDQHQPVHEDQHEPPPENPADDEATLDFGAEEETRNLDEIEKTTDLGSKRKQD